MLVQDSLHRSVARTPDKVALVCDGSRLTYGEIEAAANRLANALLKHGVKRGDRVGIFLNNSVEAVVSIFGILKAGAVFVVINHTTKEDKLAYILNNCHATALVGDAQKQPLFDSLLERVQSLRFVVLAGRSTPSVAGNDARLLDYAEIQATGSADRPRQVNIDVDLACLIYTSGSTGDPKGVMSDHSNVVFAATSITTYLQNVKDDVVLSVLPLSFDYGLYQLLMTFHFGGRLVLERSFAYPSAVLQRLEQERVTGFPGVPTMFAILVGMDLTSYDLSALRYITNTAAALPPSHILTLRRKFPTATMFSMYGLTETKRTLYLPPDLLESKPGSVGVAIPGTEVWIADANGARLGPGQTGELVVRGRHVMRGYWEAPEATANRFRPGPIPGERLCYTGDLFSMDEDGCFYFVARRDDIIKSRGEKIAPKEVENVLYSLPGVVEAAVVGVPDPILGQAVKAFVVVNGTPVTENQVLAHCKANLEDFMVPKFVEFVDELPKTSSGKVKKLALV